MTVSEPAPVAPPADRGRAGELARAIELGIMAGRYPIGSWLRQALLAAEFDVSRTPVREALQRLEARGLVQLVPNRGALVRGPSPRDILEAYTVRAELEGLAAALAADGGMSELHRESLERANELFARAVAERSRPGASGELAEPDWIKANDIFHETIHHAAGNGRLIAIIRELHGGVPRNLTWLALSDNPELLAENVRQHERIHRALDDRDGETARSEMRRHVLGSGEAVSAWYRSRPREEPDVSA